MRSLFTRRKASARRTRLAFETLEDRIQPATFVAPDLLTQSDTGVSAFDNVTNDVRPAFAGTTTSPLGTSIALLVDDAVVAVYAVVNGGGGTFAVQPTSPLADGVHVARFRDSSTHLVSNPFTFTIDSTPPDAPPAPTITSSTNLAAVVVSFQGTAGDLLHLSIAGHELTTLTASGSPQTATVDVTGLGLDPSAPIVAQVVEEDAAGNLSVASSSANVDVTPPVLSAVSLTPDHLSPNGDGVQDIGQFRFTLSEPAYVAVHFLDVDGFDLGSIPLDLVPAGDQEFDLDVPQFSEGTYTIVLVASDQANNLGNMVDVPFTVDLTAPGTPTFALAAGQDTGVSSTDGITTITSPQFAGNAEPGATIEIREGTTVVGSTTAAGDGSWTATVPLGLGTHVLAAVVIDRAGNPSVGAGQTVVIAATDATGPLDLAPVLTMPTTLTAYRNAAVTLGSALQVADADSPNVLVLVGVDQGTVRLPSSAGLIFVSGSDTSLLTIQGSIAAVNASLASLSFDAPAGYLGAINVAVQVDDLAVNAPNGSQHADGALTITVVNRPPQIVAAPPYSMNANSTFTATNLATAFHDLDGDALTLSLVTPPAVGTLTLNANGNFTYRPPAGFAGTVSFVVKAFDGVDFSSPLTVTILVRNVGGLRR